LKFETIHSFDGIAHTHSNLRKPRARQERKRLAAEAKRNAKLQKKAAKKQQQRDSAASKGGHDGAEAGRGDDEAAVRREGDQSVSSSAASAAGGVGSRLRVCVAGALAVAVSLATLRPAVKHRRAGAVFLPVRGSTLQAGVPPA
jgi:hypothetical protein